MASAMTVAVNITGSSTGLTSAVASSNKSLASLGASTTGVSSKLAAFGNAAMSSSSQASGGFASLTKSAGNMSTMLKTGVTVAAVLAAKALFDMGAESQQVTAQLEARLAALGDRTTITMDQLNSLATEIQNYSGISDEAVGASQAMLLTFQKVAVNPEIFNQATVAVADMATAMNNGATPSMEQMSKTSIMLGKALQDPVTGATALGKAGVDKAVIAQAKAMAQAGDVMGAQKLILNELSGAQGEFAGSAMAMGNTLSGQWNIIAGTFGNALEAMVVGLMKIATPIAQVVGWVMKLVASSGLMVPVVAALAAGMAVFAAAMLMATLAGDGLLATSIALFAAWITNPVVLAVMAIVAGIVLLVKLVQAGLSAVSGGFSKMGGIMKAVLIATAPLWLPIVAVIKVVQVILKALGAVISWLAANWKGVLIGMAIAFFPITIAIGLVMAAVKILGSIISYIAGLWSSGWATISGFVTDFIATWTSGWNTIVSVATGLWNGFVNFFIGAINGIIGFINKLIEGFNKIPFHDDVPLIGKLDEVGQSAANATPKVTQLGNAVDGAGKKMSGVAQIAFKTADVMGSAWDKVGPKVSGSLSQITKAITQSLQAELHLQKNTQTVTNRLINDYGLTADQAERTLAGASPKAMATMAKASDKEFKKTGVAIQKVNHIIPSVAKNFGDAGKAVDGTSKAATGAAKSATTLGKGTETVAKSAGNAAKGTEQLGKSASKTGGDLKQTGSAGSSAAKGINAVGSSAQSGQSKISGMTTQVSHLKSELNGLPRNITIQVTVNIKKTGQSLGGVVPGLARGGVTTETNGLPLTMVGEHGPELAALPPGTRVFSHNDTAGMLKDAAANTGGGGGPMAISGKLTMVNGEAYIEGIVLDTLEDGRVVDHALTRRMRRP